MPGIHRVTLTVNAAQRYQEEVRFGRDGELCLTPELVNTLRLRLTTPLSDCERIETRWPRAVLNLFPGTFQVEITLPEEAFDPEKQRTEQYGGYAVLTNYDLYVNRLQGRYGKQQTLQAMLGPGINIGNWVIRNRSTYSKNERKGQFNVYETSASRDFPQWGTVLQTGEFGTGGGLNGGVPITGFQLSGSNSRLSSGAFIVPIQGSVLSQATVEVRQRGQMVYRTLLPAGTFTLEHLGTAVPGVESEVLITDSEGRQQRFVITPHETPVYSQGDYQLALGRYRVYGSDNGNAPALLMGEKSLGLNRGGQTGFGGLASAHYQRLAWQGSHGNEGGNWLSGNVVYSRSKKQGVQANIQGQLTTGNGPALALTSQYRTLGFRDADEGLDPAITRVISEGQPTIRLRYAGGVSLSWGALTYSLTHERYYHSNQQHWGHTISWGQRVGSASFSLSLQSSSLERAALFASVSFPFAGGRVSHRAQQRRDNQMVLGSSWQRELSSGMNGYLDIARDSNGEYQTSGNLNGSTPYSTFSLGASHAGQGNSSLMLGAGGAMAVANNTLVTSPYSAGDTMMVLKIPGQSGVNITGSGGGVTDYAGDVLLSSLTPYTPLTAQIDTLSTPLNLRFDSTDVTFELARGTVAQRQFRVTEVRQLLLTLKDAQGVTLPVGSSVYDEKGRLMGTLMGNGNLLLVNEDIGIALRVRRVNQNECRVSYTVPASFDPTALYEEGDGICH